MTYLLTGERLPGTSEERWYTLGPFGSVSRTFSANNDEHACSKVKAMIKENGELASKRLFKEIDLK